MIFYSSKGDLNHKVHKLINNNDAFDKSRDENTENKTRKDPM